MDFSPEKKKKITAWLIGIVTLCILIFLGVQNIAVVAKAFSWIIHLISPLLLGLAFAIVLNVPMRYFESHIWHNSPKAWLQKSRRPVSFVLSLVFIIGIVIGVVWLVIPELFSAIKVIVQELIDFTNTLGAMDEEELSALPFGSVLLNTDWDEIIASSQAWLKNQSGTIMNTAFGTISSFFGSVFNFFVSFVFAIYILFNKENLKRQICRLLRVWLPESLAEWLIHAASIANKNFRNFISGQSLEACILGVLCMIGMLILNIPYAPMVGALVGVTALIPVIGGFIGAIVGAFMIITINPFKAFVFIIYLLILQQLEGNLIYPKVMGNRVNLPAMWILAAVTVGGGIAGPIGMLLSVPVASTIYVLVKEATDKREMKKKLVVPK